MKPTGRFAALALVLAVLLGACTSRGGDGGNHTASASGSAGGGTESPTGSFSGPPGTALYAYSNAGLTATMHLEGNTGTLEVHNGTGRELPKPSFYILDARDGHQVDGQVDGATSIPDGETRTFDVSYSGLDLKNIGLLVLLMGRDNYGAFVRQ